jgi:hypothetical protein
MTFRGMDSGGNVTNYGFMGCDIVSPTDTAESGVVVFWTMAGGPIALRLSLGAGLFMAGATGGDKGTGTVNATAYYTNGVKTIPETPVALSIATSAVATDASLSKVFTVTLTENVTLSNPTNGVDGQRVVWRIRQDATGSRLLTLDSKFRLGTDIATVTLTTTAAKTDYLTAIYHASDDKWDVVAFVKGF